MKSRNRIFAWLLAVCLLTGCSGGAGSAPKEDSAASTGDAASVNASAEAAVSAAEAQAAIEQTPGTYKNIHGWTMYYDPSLVEISEDTGDRVEFLFTGEQTGENSLVVEYIPDKQPQEVLTEQIEEYDEDAVSREEGFAGADKWCFCASVDDSDELTVTIDYTALEHKGGVLLSKVTSSMETESTLEMLGSDTLHDMVNSMNFEDTEPQTMFSYYPGAYQKADETKDGPGSIILYDDHSGIMKAEEEEDLPLLWTSNELMVKNEETSWEFTIEGDYLYLNVEDDWIEYKRDASASAESRPGTDSMTSSAKELLAAEEPLPDQPADTAQSAPAEKTPEEYAEEIEELYTMDGPGTIGRIHKMQAFLMELALHAKTRNPDFKVVVQGAEYLGFTDGNVKKELQPSMMALIDGWGNEGMVGKSAEYPANPVQSAYLRLIDAGKYVSDTTVVNSEEDLTDYLSKAHEWGVVPFPRVGGELARELYPGQRWADNFDYFWVEDTDKIGLSEYTDGSRDVNDLTEAKTYLYNINGRPYDNWNLWDQEEAAFTKGSGDRTRITDSYACGLLVPSENGSYMPSSEDPEDEAIAEIIAEYGDHWDWWWREAGLDENAGRQAWLDQLRNSDYDVIYIDSCYNHRAGPDSLTPLTREEVESLKTKPDGGRRQVLSYLAIGTAEQNRWYCQDGWRWIDPSNLNSTYSMKTGQVRWLGNRSYYIPFEATEAGQEAEGEAIPTWLAFSFGDEYPEESVVQWWHKDWRDIIINGGGKYSNIVTGDKTSSIDRIIDQGFDGVYLDNAESCWDDAWFAYEDYWAERGGIPTE